MKTEDEIVDLGYFIPPMPNKSHHHVISRGQHPKFYRPDDLGDKGMGKTAWVDAFEKILVGLFWVTGAPIPYAFTLPDGTIRSLDAGCIKMLLNREPPDVNIEVDGKGYIEAVIPSERLLRLYAPMETMLRKRILNANKED